MLWTLPHVPTTVAGIFLLPHISLPADTFSIGWFQLANTVIISVINALIIIGIFSITARRRALVPGFLQNAVEWGTGMLLNLCEDVAGKEKGRRFFPLVASLFFFILLGNLWEIVPGVETIGVVSHSTDISPACAHATGPWLTGATSNCLQPFIRPPSTDLNFTIALAIVSVVAVQFYGFRILGWRLQVGRYFTLKEGPIGLVVGLLEFILEWVRIISLGFRLFGNLFAGDLLLLVIGFLIPVVGALPFYFLEIFVGFIQAFVFAMLTLLFATLGTTPPEHGDAAEEHAAEVAAGQRAVAAEAVAEAH